MIREPLKPSLAPGGLPSRAPVTLCGKGQALPTGVGKPDGRLRAPALTQRVHWLQRCFGAQRTTDSWLVLVRMRATWDLFP